MPVTDYTPDVTDVGALLRARTVDAGGNETGTFSSTNRPTDTQVQSIIQDVILEAYPVFGESIPDDPTPGGDPATLRKAAARLVAFRAAELVEASFFPEQVASGRSPAPIYHQSWVDGLVRVTKAIAEVAAGEEPGEDANTITALYDGFPVDSGGGLVGWGSNW